MKKSFFEKILPHAIVLLLVFSFFAPKLMQNRIPIPADSLLGLYHPFRDISIDNYAPGKYPTKNPLITDGVLQTYPWREKAIENLKSGHIPAWNPYSFSGQPLLANVQSAPFQFLNLLFFVLPFNLAWALIIIIPSMLTAIFMYLFLREVNLSKTASVFGALVLPFSGFFIAWLTWGTIVTTAMWLPLILYLLEKLSRKVTPVPFILLVFATSQVIFSGHLQTALYVLTTAALYAIYLFKTNKSTAFLKISALGFGLGILASSVQVFPALEFIQNSARDLDQGFAPGRPDWFIPIQNLIQLVAPDYFGNPATYNYWGVWNYAEFVSYVGIVPLSLVLFSTTSKNKAVLFFTGLLALSLVFALQNPISKIPYLMHFPFIKSLQPSRILVLISFSLATLSAIGLDQFFEEKNKKRLVAFGSLVFLSVIVIAAITYFSKDMFPQAKDLDPHYIALRNLAVPLILSGSFMLILLSSLAKIPKTILVILIFTLTTLDLFRFGYKFTPFSKIASIYPQTKTTAFLQEQQKPFRITTQDRRLMHPNTSTYYDIESIDGYDPLYLKDYSQFISIMQSNNPDEKISSFNRIITPQNHTSRFLDLLNVKYVLSLNTIDSPNLTQVLAEGETKIYENKNALPRAFFVDGVKKLNNQQEEYSMLVDTTFDISKVATSTEYAFAQQSIQSEVKISQYSDANIILETQSSANRPLLLTNVNTPGWKAEIDGHNVPIYKADGIFQLIEVPQGTHKVEFKYAPDSFYNGLIMSVAATVAALFVTFLIWRKKYQ